MDIKSLFTREHEIHGSSNLVGEDCESFPAAMPFLQSGMVRFALKIAAQKKDGGLSEGPFQMGVADFFTGSAHAFTAGFLGAFDQAAIKDKILEAWEPVNVLDLIQDQES